MREGFDSLDVDWEPEWWPRFRITHMIGQIVDWERSFCAAAMLPGYGRAQGTGARGNTDGTIWIRGVYRASVTVSEGFDLHDFPFDVQDLNLRVQLHGGVAMAPLTDAVGIPGGLGAWAVRLDADGCELPEFTLFPRVPAVCRMTARGGLHVIVFLERQEEYYIVNILSVCALVGLCSAVGWAVHWREVANRLGVDVTLILVAVALKQVLASMTPPISYLTSLDEFALMCGGFTILAAVFHAAIGFTIVDCDPMTGNCDFVAGTLTMDTAYTVDRACMYAQLGVMAAYFVPVLHQLLCFRLIYSVHIFFHTQRKSTTSNLLGAGIRC